MSHPPSRTPMTNTQSTLSIPPDFHKCISSSVLFGSSGSSGTITTQSDVFIFPYFLKYRDPGRAKEYKICYSSECRVPRRIFRMPFWTRLPLDREPRSRIKSPNTHSPYYTLCSSDDISRDIPVIWNLNRLYSIAKKMNTQVEITGKALGICL
jgi:hypothetical protein